MLFVCVCCVCVCFFLCQCLSVTSLSGPSLSFFLSLFQCVFIFLPTSFCRTVRCPSFLSSLSFFQSVCFCVTHICLSSQCVVSVTPLSVDYETIIVGDEISRSFTIANDGALGTDFTVTDITYVYMYILFCVCVCVNVYMHVCLYVCMYVMYVCMYVCMYVTHMLSLRCDRPDNQRGDGDASCIFTSSGYIGGYTSQLLYRLRWLRNKEAASVVCCALRLLCRRGPRRYHLQVTIHCCCCCCWCSCRCRCCCCFMSTFSCLSFICLCVCLFVLFTCCLSVCLFVCCRQHSALSRSL